MFLSTTLLIVFITIFVSGIAAFIVAMYHVNESVHRDTKLELTAVEQTRVISEKPIKIKYKY